MPDYSWGEIKLNNDSHERVKTSGLDFGLRTLKTHSWTPG